MMQSISVWLSYFSIMLVSFTPLVLFHWYFVARGISLRASVFVQKILSVLILIVPFIVLIGLSRNSIQENKQAFEYTSSDELPISVVTPVTQVPIALSPKSTSGLAISDIWFPFVGFIFVSCLLGFILFVSRILLQEYHLRKLQVESSEVDPSGIKIFTGSQIQVPFSIGIWNKRIFLPQTLNELEQPVIRKHELNHCHLNHHAWSMLEALQTHLFWFNPLAHILRKTGNLLREVECDEQSTKNSDRVAYSKILIQTAEKFAMSGMMPIRGQGWNHIGGLRMRLNNLLAQNKMQRIAMWLGSFVTVAIFAIFGTFYFASRIDSATETSLLRTIRDQYVHVQQSNQLIEFKKVPSHFIKALLLHEDKSFFKHDGISHKAVLRATGTNLFSFVSGGAAPIEGGSTITQQLAKHFLAERETSIGRKFREYKLARVLESHFSKDEILEMYLNMVYFGNQTTGLAQAAQYYYQTSYDQLTPSQSAMLIPFLEAPSKFNMIANPQIAEQRKNQLMAMMNADSH